MAILGRYLFGSRWQTALAQRLAISRQIVGYWARAERPVSRTYSAELAQIVGTAHDRRIRRDRARYRAMVESLDLPDARELMLAMLAAEIELRVNAITRLVQPPAPSRSPPAAHAPAGAQPPHRSVPPR